MHIVKFTIYKSHFLCWQIFLDWAQVKLVYVPWTNDFQFFLLLFDYSHPSFTCSLVLLPSTDLTLSVPESEVKVLVAQLCLDCLSLHGLQPTRLFCPWILQSGILEWVAMPFFRGSSQPRDCTRSPALQVDSLPAEPPEKPKNIGMCSLSLLQWIFPTQESNQGLLNCRWILYQLGYQGILNNPH